MLDTQIITCPRCQRELRALRTPHCLWCGENISDQDFAAVGVTPSRREVVDLPPLTSYNMQARSWQSPYQQVNQRPLQRWEIKFRKTFAIMAGIFLIIKLCDVIYAWYLLHHLLTHLQH